MNKLIIYILVFLSTSSLAQNNEPIKEYQMHYMQLTNPITCSISTKVYSLPDSSSKIIEVLDFNSPIIPIKNSEISDWILIQWLSDTAYVKRADVALYSFYSSKNDEILYFLTQQDQSTIINKFDITQQQLIDTLVVSNFSPDRIEYINSEEWINTELIIGLNHDGNCCGCSDQQIYLMDANKDLNIIFKTSQYQGDGEIEEGFTSNIYFPNDPTKENMIYSEHGYEEGESKGTKKEYQWDGKNIIEQK